MTTTVTPTIGSAATQGDLWSARARDWARIQESQSSLLFEAILDRAITRRGTLLLDAGCGAGLACLMAFKRGAVVAGVDAAPGMIAMARERLPQVEFKVGELEQLPYADDVFDVVTGFNSFQYAANPVTALKEARRVTTRGGRVFAATWGAADYCEAAPFLAALGALLAPPPPGAPGPFALSAPGALEELMRQSGLEPGEALNVDCSWQYADLETAMRGLLSLGPAVKAMRYAGEEAVRQLVASTIQPYRTSHGGYQLENRFRFVVGRT